MIDSFNSYKYDKSSRKGKAAKPIDILVGCPIQKRDWIIGEWFWHVEAACKIAGLKPSYIFVLDPNEEPLNTMIHNLASMNGRDLWLCEIKEEQREDKRVWNYERYEKMVELRNILLCGVRKINPPLFLSLDSDILLNKDSLKSMYDNINGYAAIGGKAYMTHVGTQHPSYANISSQGNLLRQDSTGIFKVDVIMAIKLMKPKAYNVDYELARHGEDIGWSKAVRNTGEKLCWDGTFTSKHIMRREEVDKVDIRAGY